MRPHNYKEVEITKEGAGGEEGAVKACIKGGGRGICQSKFVYFYSTTWIILYTFCVHRCGPGI